MTRTKLFLLAYSINSCEGQCSTHKLKLPVFFIFGYLLGNFGSRFREHERDEPYQQLPRSSSALTKILISHCAKWPADVSTKILFLALLPVVKLTLLFSFKRSAICVPLNQLQLILSQTIGQQSLPLIPLVLRLGGSSSYSISFLPSGSLLEERVVATIYISLVPSFLWRLSLRTQFFKVPLVITRNVVTMYHLARTVWGLVQLHAFRSWCARAIDCVTMVIGHWSLRWNQWKRNILDTKVKVSNEVVENEFNGRDISVKFDFRKWRFVVSNPELLTL